MLGRAARGARACGRLSDSQYSYQIPPPRRSPSACAAASVVPAATAPAAHTMPDMLMTTSGSHSEERPMIATASNHIRTSVVYSMPVKSRKQQEPRPWCALVAVRAQE